MTAEWDLWWSLGQPFLIQVRKLKPREVRSSEQIEGRKEMRGNQIRPHISSLGFRAVAFYKTLLDLTQWQPVTSYSHLCWQAPCPMLTSCYPDHVFGCSPTQVSFSLPPVITALRLSLLRTVEPEHLLQNRVANPLGRQFSFWILYPVSLTRKVCIFLA